MAWAYIRLAGWVVLAASVVIAVLIPVQACIDTTCASRALWEDIPNVEADYRWPLRIGIVAAGVVVLLVTFAVTSPGRGWRGKHEA